MVMGNKIKQADFSLEIDKEQWKEVIEMARSLAPEIGQKAVSKVIDDGTERILHSMKYFATAKADNPTGNLQRNLVKKKKRKYEPGFYLSAVAVNTGKTRKDGAYYWNMVEQGHKVVTRKKVDTGKRVAAMQYAISSFELNRPLVLTDFARRVRAQLEKSWGNKK